jgi:hypothetical protein
VTRRLAAGLAIAAVVFGGACEKKDQDKQKVVHAVDATTPLEHRFSYEVVTQGAGTVKVQGIVEDDFRYKLQLALNGTPSVEEIASDDAVAVRFLDPGLVDGYTDKAVIDKIDQKTSVPGASVLDVLRARRWVLDEAGAPSSVVEVRDEARGAAALAALANGSKNRDPLFEARTALAYVRRTAQAGNFVEYDAETLNPTYRTGEDPFPKPKDGSDVTRYDAVLDDLPAASAATSGSVPQLPTIKNFRKMAVYVKGGRIIAVREFIGLSPRQRKDLRTYLTAVVDATAPDEVKRSFRAQTSKLERDPQELGNFLVEALNTFVVTAGRDPIRFRTMSLELQDFGAVDEQVALPGDAIKGDLALLQNLGRKPTTAATDQGARPAVPQSSSPTADETATTIAGG